MLRKGRRSLSVILVFAILALSIFYPNNACAAETEEGIAKSFPLYCKGEIEQLDENLRFNLENVKDIKISNSNPEVASICKIRKKTVKVSFYSKATYYDAYIKLKNRGTTNICISYGSQKYQYNVSVTKTEKPIKTIKISGVKGGKNLLSQINNMNYCMLTCKKAKKSVLKITPKTGWTVKDICCFKTNEGVKIYDSLTNKINIGNIDKNEKCYIYMCLTNGKKTMNVNVLINYDNPLEVFQSEKMKIK